MSQSKSVAFEGLLHDPPRSAALFNPAQPPGTQGQFRPTEAVYGFKGTQPHID